VYGAEVLPVGTTGPIKQVKITPGFILTPQGDEIEIITEQPFDPSQGAIPAGPEYSVVNIDRGQGKANTQYLAVRYKEVNDGPVHVPPAVCGCADQPCEYSRVRDCYEIRLLENLPASYAQWTAWTGPAWAKGVVDAMSAAADVRNIALLSALLPDALSPAPTEPADGWVVLADLRFGPDGLLQSIDQVSHRRMVMSLAPVWWRPIAEQPVIVEVKVFPQSPSPGTVRYQLQVGGRNLYPSVPADVTLAGFQVDSFDPDRAHFGEKLYIAVSHAGAVTAVTTARLEITNPDGSKVSTNVAMPIATAPPAAAPAGNG
jgi:hypothetical protein